MRGFGTVYEMYAAPDGLDVDEVALLHEAELPHRPLSEPMAHIRFFPYRLKTADLVGFLTEKPWLTV